MIPISICIIAKNEANYLYTCLSRLQKYCFELIIVDTGSSDNTIDVAQSFTPFVFSFPWCDDFSAARNYALSKATNDFVLNIDCDEHLTSFDQDALLLQLNNWDKKQAVGRINLTSNYVQNNQLSSETTKIARFFSKSFFRFDGSIHEQIVPISPSGTPLNYQSLPLHFYHEGYRNEVIIQEKSRRNIILLEKALTQNKKDPYLYFQLGQSYFVTNNYEKALSYFTPALSFDIDPSTHYIETLILSYGYSLLATKQYEAALLLEGIYSEFCNSADFVFLMGLIYMNNGLFTDAISQFELATTFKTASVHGVNSYKAYYNLGVIYECSNHIDLAKKYYSQCHDYEVAKKRLAQLSNTNESRM